ncbi:MAG: O-succinylhomoserine (thiol)-lyase [Nitrobacter sp. 62-13]|uniref:cystathionine gamma-synthase n=1 Tax=Nitrobacter sp. 62-13 TaxID=1895797 RepID=UPI000962AE1B|nr:cystathionine gamma-synthase [Nitrobacter sp. 62-13]OJU30463.1 MAG: O-succinylhomoserine (thiol)-lyase [Nitrobacter sp. 62-13]
MSESTNLKTVAAANGIATEDNVGAVTPTICLSSTFTWPGFGRSGPHEYTRTSNPTRTLLADTLAKLEGGAGAVVVSSGMAAIDLVLSQLSRDDIVIVPHDCYGGTHRLLVNRRDRGHFKVAFVDQNDPAALIAAFQSKPKLVLIETPSNPLMRIVDIRAIVAQARAAGAKVAVDNTFLSPALQRPIALGADFVIHSTTKYLNGHSDMVGGAVIAADAADAEALAAWANIVGTTGAPFDSYLALRGIRTLFPRMEWQQRSAQAVAEFLAEHPLVAACHYPGLPTHPGHAVAKAQQSGFGAMLSFELKGSGLAVARFVEAVRLFSLAESLGGTESLLAHPATMTHASMSEEARKAAGITNGLIRLSIGLEDTADLIADLERALAEIDGSARSKANI